MLFDPELKCLNIEVDFPPESRFPHPDAGWRSAVIYSLLITARRYRLDPTAWLSDVLRRIPTCTQANLPELLPGNWKPQAA